MSLEAERYHHEGHRVRFGTCVYPQRPECETADRSERHGCAAGDWELIRCYLDHYGNELSPEAEVLLMDAFVHLLVNNNAPDAWEIESAAPVSGKRRPKEARVS